MTVEKFIGSGKVTSLAAEKIIGLIILKANTNIEIIKTYILNLEQKLSSVAFFAVDKINIIFIAKFNHNYYL